MKITEQDRLELRQQLTNTIGAQSTNVLMEALPPVDYNQLATKTDLKNLRRDLEAQSTVLRGEMSLMKGEIMAESAKQMRIIVTANMASMLALAGIVLQFG